MVKNLGRLVNVDDDEELKEHIPKTVKIKGPKENSFRWSVTRALNPVKENIDRITEELEKQASKLNWNGIEFLTPCTEQQFKTFEKNNNITITVVHENGSPIYIPAPSKNMNIFLCYENDRYYSILKIGRLVGKNISKNQYKKYVCPFCLNAFGNEDLLLKHEKYCREHDCVNTVFPEPGKNTLKFKNLQNSIKCPIKIYADFESILEPMSTTKG